MDCLLHYQRSLYRKDVWGRANTIGEDIKSKVWFQKEISIVIKRNIKVIGVFVGDMSFHHLGLASLL